MSLNVISSGTDPEMLILIYDLKLLFTLISVPVWRERIILCLKASLKLRELAEN
jgi:hypothetical protein